MHIYSQTEGVLLSLGKGEILSGSTNKIATPHIGERKVASHGTEPTGS